jgi:hypothetical protein
MHIRREFTGSSVRISSEFDSQNEDNRPVNFIEHAVRAYPITPCCRLKVGQAFDVRPADWISSKDWVYITSEFVPNPSLFVRRQL